MPEEPIENTPPHDRRAFFRSSLSRMLQPLAGYIESKLPVAFPASRERLRPPGAIAEDKFLDTCFRCGKCADACPANAIALVREHQPRHFGTPYIDPNERACVICDELACMKVCPSGALKLVDRLEIRIGLAKVDDNICVRPNGESCTICIDSCPLGNQAIRLGENGMVEVIKPDEQHPGCTGCGVCQERCPTRSVRAIQVFPY